MTYISPGSCHAGAAPVPFPTFPSDTPTQRALLAPCPQHCRTAGLTDTGLAWRSSSRPQSPWSLVVRGWWCSTGGTTKRLRTCHPGQPLHTHQPHTDTSPTAVSQCSFPVHPVGPQSQIFPSVTCKKPWHRHMSWLDHSPLAQQEAPPPQNRLLNTRNPS